LLALACGLFLGGAGFLWRNNALAAAAGFLIGVLLIVGIFVYVRSRRRSAIREQLPEAMDMLARAVRAGESIDQAVHVAGKTLAEPLATEFRRCDRQLQMGLSLDGAVRGMTRRAPVMEMRIMATTVTVQRRTGGSLPTALEHLARVFRDRLSYHRQFRAATAQGRGSVIVIAIAGLVAATYLFVWQPEYMQGLLQEPIGQALLAIAVVLQILGLAWVFWLLRSNY
jgi:tight adherence protein B